MKLLCFGVVLYVAGTFASSDNRITNDELNKKIITDEERRAAETTHDDKDQVKTETKLKRGLFNYGSTKQYPHSGGYVHSSSGPSSYGSSFSSSGPDYPYPPQQHSSYGSVGHYLPPSSHGYDHGPPSGYGSSGSGYGHEAHGGHGHNHGHSLALKGLLIPLAGIALLGAAAALSTHPVLLQLGVVNGRKKRSINPEVYKTMYPPNPYVTPDK